jgi:putative flippase GtrA
MNSVTPVNTVGAFVRFAIVGIVSNAMLFVLYLVLTQLAMGHKLAASLAYAVGVSQTFLFNRSWSFRDGGALGPAFIRYLATYAFGYLLNMLVLVVLVDRMDYPHQWVQGAMILVLAVMLFVAQRFWVFREGGRGR